MSREPNALLTPNRPNGGQRHPASNIVRGRSIAKRRRTWLFCLARNARSAGENNRGPGLVSPWLSFRFKASTRVLGFWDSTKLASGDENYSKGDTKMVLKMRVACYAYCYNAVPISAYLLY